MKTAHSEKKISPAFIANYVSSQLEHFFPDNNNPKKLIAANTKEALEKINYSVSFVKLKGFGKFSYLHSDLYAQFVYFLSNIIWKKEGANAASTKLFYLNKALHGFNCMYDTQLPDIFLFTHPVGSVIGKAVYSDYIVFCQNITIGMHKGKTPVLGKNIFLATQSIILGNTVIEGDCSVGAGSIIMDEQIAANKTVSGRSPALKIKNRKRDILKEMYFI